jgi:thioredoxin-dependent peroxiredoxin
LGDNANPQVLSLIVLTEPLHMIDKRNSLNPEKEAFMSNLEGQQAPAFNLDGSDGKRHSLADYRGKNVILYFYPKDDTPGCTKEACGFRDSMESVTKSNAVVLGVSKDGLESHNQFIAKYNLPFTLLSDPEAKVMKSYGAWGERKNMEGKTVEGAIRSTVVISPDGKVLRQWTPVTNAEEHPSEVLQFLEK